MANSLMPGESMGMPSRIGGLLDDPLLQLGLGILANNNGNYGSFGAAIGKGGMQAISSLRQQRQLDYERQLRDIQLQTANRALKKDTDLDAAKAAFKLAHPEYATEVDLDPALAIKAANPSIGRNGADPFFQTVATDKGLMVFDARKGTLVPAGVDGLPLVKSTDSPQVRGAVKSAESEAAASFKPNTDIPGIVSTNAQVSRSAYGGQPMPFSSGQSQSQPQALPTNNFNTPYPVTMGGFGAPGTTATDRAEGVNSDADVQLRDPRFPNRPVRPIGISVPTKDEQAGLNKTAVIKAEAAANAQIDLPTAIANAQNASKQIDELIGSRDGRIKPHPGFIPAVGLSSKIDPRNYLAGTNATDFNTRLDQLKGGQFLQAFNSLRGGGSITEVEGKKATDAIARMNTAQTEEEFVKSARDYQDVIDAGLKRQMAKAGMSANSVPQDNSISSALPLPAKPSALTLKKGARYMTPKGELTWNGKAFED